MAKRTPDPLRMGWTTGRPLPTFGQMVEMSRIEEDRVGKITVAVIGGGLIGVSWSALFLAHGHAVRIYDPSPEVLSRTRDALEAPLSQLAELGAVSDAPFARLTLCSTLAEALEGATLVQENAPEKVALKRELYREIEALVPDDLLIASSTSSLIWSELAAEMRRPERLVTAHPFNPPHLMPLVELYGPEPQMVARAERFYRGVGRVTVRLKREAVGHIANRLASALWREAVNIVAEDIAEVEDVDRALVHGPGLRWSVVGAHMAYHLGGGAGGIAHYLAHLGPSQERRWETLGAPKLSPEVCARLTAGIAAEARGRSITELEAERDAALIERLKAARKPI